MVAVLFGLTSTGCGPVRDAVRPSMDIDYDDQRLIDALRQVRDTGTSAFLREFTSWEWDEVHLFNEHTERDFIEDTVGAPVIKDRFYGSKASLLVFERDGEPVKAAGISGDFLRGKDHRVSFPADATVQGWGGGFVLLAAP